MCSLHSDTGWRIRKLKVVLNVVEAIHGGKGDLVCCGKGRVLQKENTVDAAREKHVPGVEKTAGGTKVKVGNVPRPMEEKT